MADASFVAEMVDRISGPAKRAAAGVSKLTAKIGRGAKAWRSADGRLRGLDGRFAQGEKSALQMAFSFESVMRAAKVAGAAVLAMGVAVAGIAVGFGVAVAKGAIFNEKALFGLERFLGSASKAKAELSKLRAISNKLGISLENAVQSFSGFISAGLSTKMAREMVLFRADVEALGTVRLDLVENAFQQMEKAIVAGRFEMDGFMSVLAAIPGATKANVIERVAKLTGKSVKELGKNITDLPVKETIEAMKQLFIEGTKGKALGDVAFKKATQTMGGLIKVLTANFTNAFSEIGGKLAPVIGQKILPLLRKMTEGIKTPEFAAKIDAIVSIMGDLIGAAANVANFIIRNWSRIKTVLKVLAVFFGALAIVITLVAVVIATMVASFIAGFVAIAAVIAAPIVAIIKLVQFVRDNIGKLPNILSEAANSAAQAALGVGKAIISGIVNGIKGGLSSVVGAITAVATSAINSAKKAFGQSSPSKVFAAIGMHNAEGLAQGHAQGAGVVSRSMTRMASPPPMRGGGATTNNVTARMPVSISVQAADDPEATAEAVRRMFVSSFADVLEQINLQVGASSA